MSTVMHQFSEGLADAVAKASDSIVRVEGRRRLPGSGIVWSADGLIVTANHVAKRKDKINIGLPTGETISAEVVGRDGATDLAVLKVDAPLVIPSWSPPTELRVGQLVLALGRPGSGIQTTLGVVSALGGAWQTGAGGKVSSYLQTDVVMYPGFSGGALINVEGTVIGLISSALSRGVSLTLPEPTLRRVVEALVEHGQVRRGYLGVGVQTARLPASAADSLEQETGVLISSVEADSAAEDAGLVLGDTLVTLDNEAIRRVDDLQAVLSDDRAGKTLTVQIVRGGQLQEMTVTVGEH